MTAAAWSVKANNKSYRTDGTYRIRLRLSYGSGAAGIGRGEEPTGVIGWVTGDRLRRVWLILITKH